MLAFFQSPLIIEFAATTPVIQGIFTFDINLSYLAYIRTILANEGSKSVSLVPQVKPFKPGLFPCLFFHSNHSRTNGAHNIVMRRNDDFFPCHLFECRLHAAISSHSPLKEDGISDFSILDHPVDEVQHHRITQTS